MATTIASECIHRGLSARADGASRNDPEHGTECDGFHCQEACLSMGPVECCVSDAARPGTEADLAALAVKLQPDDARLRSRVDSNSFLSRNRPR